MYIDKFGTSWPGAEHLWYDVEPYEKWGNYQGDIYLSEDPDDNKDLLRNTSAAVQYRQTFIDDFWEGTKLGGE